MPNFYVRERGTRVAIGLFAVDQLSELVEQVSRLLDPETCEYAEVRLDTDVYDTLSFSTLKLRTGANDN